MWRMWPRNAGGFSLLEAVVALALLAVAGLLASQAFHSGVAGLRGAAAQERLIELATSKMEWALADETLDEPGVWHGQSDGFEWQVTLEEFEPPLERDIRPEELPWLAVRVDARAVGTERPFVLQSLKKKPQSSAAAPVPRSPTRRGPS